MSGFATALCAHIHHLTPPTWQLKAAALAQQACHRGGSSWWEAPEAVPRALLLPALLPSYISQSASTTKPAAVLEDSLSCNRWRRLVLLSCNDASGNALALALLDLLRPVAHGMAKSDARLAARVLAVSHGLQAADDDLLLRLAVCVASSKSTPLTLAARQQIPLAAPVAVLCYGDGAFVS